MCKWLIRTAVTLALLMNILAPSRFAATSLCNLSFIHSTELHVRSSENSAHSIFASTPQQHKTSARDFSIVAGLEIGNDSLAVLLASPVRLQSAAPLERGNPSVSLSPPLHHLDLLTLHSRRNI